jgi:hypothetical protein
MSEFFDNEPDIITIAELNQMNIEADEELNTMNREAHEEVKQMIIEGHVEKADEEVKQMITSEPDQKEPVEKRHIIKIKFKIEHILIGLLTTCGTLILLISYHPMIVIDLLICIIIIVLGSLYIVDKNLTMKILETCLLSIPLFISKSPIFLI